MRDLATFFIVGIIISAIVGFLKWSYHHHAPGRHAQHPKSRPFRPW
jgi:hypothetical protein